MSEIRIYAVISGIAQPQSFTSLGELKKFAAGNSITSIQYMILTTGTTVPTTYMFNRSNGKLVAAGYKGYDVEVIAVPQELVNALEPLTFVKDAKIGLLIEDEPGALGIKAYGVSDPLAAVRATLNALTDIGLLNK